MSTSSEVVIPSYVKRFLGTLDEYGLAFNDEKYRHISGPFYVESRNSGETFALMGSENAEWGEIHQWSLTLYHNMWPPISALIQHIWREVIQEERLLSRIAALEAECAEKTRRLDQIAAIIKGDK